MMVPSGSARVNDSGARPIFCTAESPVVERTKPACLGGGSTVRSWRGAGARQRCGQRDPRLPD